MTTKKQSNVSAVPEGRRSLAPYLCVRGASKAMDFYARAFGARELFHMSGPGNTDHACGNADRGFGSNAGGREPGTGFKIARGVWRHAGQCFPVPTRRRRCLC